MKPPEAFEFDKFSLNMAKVCQTCGDRGFEEALVYCDSCKIEVIHRYCMGITPVPYTEDITWLCEDCDSDRIDIITITDFDSDSDGSEDGKLRNVLEKEKKKRSSDQTSPDLGVEDHIEPLKISFSLVKETPNKPTRRIHFIEIPDSDSDCDGSDVGKTAKREKKENSNNHHVSPGSAVEDQIEPVKVPSSTVKKTTKEFKRRRRFVYISDSDSDCDGSDVGKTTTREKKENCSNHAWPGSTVENHVEPVKVPSSTVKETIKESTRRRRFIYISDSDSDCDGSDVGKNTTREKKENSKNHVSPGSTVEDHVKLVKVPSSTVKKATKEYKRRRRFIYISDSESDCDGSDVGKTATREKKENCVVKETMKEHEVTRLVRKKAFVLEAKKSSSNSNGKEGDKIPKPKHILKKDKKEKSSNPTSLVLASKDHVKHVKVSSSTVKETMKESKIRQKNEAYVSKAKTSSSNSIRKEVDHTAKPKHILKNEKKKKSNNHTLTDFAVKDHVETVKVSSSTVKETMKESKGRERLDHVKPPKSSVSKAKKSVVPYHIEVDPTGKLKYILRKQINNHNSPVLAVNDHVEPMKVSSSSLKETMKESKRCESSDPRKPHESTRLPRNEESVSKTKMPASNSNRKESDQTAKLKYILKEGTRYYENGAN